MTNPKIKTALTKTELSNAGDALMFEKNDDIEAAKKNLKVLISAMECGDQELMRRGRAYLGRYLESSLGSSGKEHRDMAHKLLLALAEEENHELSDRTKGIMSFACKLLSDRDEFYRGVSIDMYRIKRDLEGHLRRSELMRGKKIES